MARRMNPQTESNLSVDTARHLANAVARKSAARREVAA